jgi:predicted nucleic acid-binding protein
MNGLIDTTVWVNHFRAANAALIGLLESDLVLGHPLVLAEIACGTPPSPRAQTLEGLGLLRPAQQASLPEVMAFIEREKLYGLG